MPKGNLLGFFFYTPEVKDDFSELDGPPYPLNPVQAKELFSGFRLIEEKSIDQSLSFCEARGRERWQQWEKL